MASDGLEEKHTKTTTNDVAVILGVSATTLKTWEMFLSLDIERTPKGARRYTQDNIKQLKKIKKLLSDGLTLKEVKAQLNQPPDDCGRLDPKIEIITDEPEKNQNFELAIINKYESRIVELTEKQENLNRQLGRIEGELNKYNEITALKDSQINEKEGIIADLKARLKLYESRKWWQIWK